MNFSIPLSLSLILLQGCAWHGLRENVRPAVEAEAVYSVKLPTEVALNQSPWWQSFQNEKLNEMVVSSLKFNPQILQAQARFLQAQSRRKVISTESLPQLNFILEAARQEGGFGLQGESLAYGGALSWELDLFGRISSEANALQYAELAAGYELRLVELAVSAEVAATFYAAIEQQKRLELLAEQIKTNQTLLKLIESRFKQGVSAKVDVLQQQSQLTLIQSLVPETEADLREYENRLDTLLGEAPQPFIHSVGQEFASVTVLPPLGVPSELLLRRPDLRAAQARLIAADAGIAAAIAQRFPRLTLTGSYLQRSSGGDMNPISTLAAELLLPLIDWGRRRALVSENKALYTEQLAEFTEQFIEAVEQVETALFREVKKKEYIALLNTRQNLLTQTLDQTRSRYQQGLTDYLPVLDALKELNEVQQTLLSENRLLIENRIVIFRALGGSLVPAVQKDPS